MTIKINRDGSVEVDDARIIFRNFSGRPSKYNHEGERNFALIIPDEETKDMLVDNGWNVRIKPPREDGEPPFMYLPINIKFKNKRGPIIYLISGDSRITLDQPEDLNKLDDIDIMRVDFDFNPNHWEMNGRSGISAYLSFMEITQRLNRFQKKYLDVE